MTRVSHWRARKGLEQGHAYEESGKDGEDDADNLELRGKRYQLCGS